jgi:ech hydrogenase subunit D
MDHHAFLGRVADYRRGGWRLAVINATPVLGPAAESSPTDGYDVIWSFARNGDLEHLRERVAPGEGVPSIGGSYADAYLYENELQELFGIPVNGLELDLRGQLYGSKVRVPFSVSAVRARLKAQEERS